MLRDCAVCECEDSEVPQLWKAEEGKCKGVNSYHQCTCYPPVPSHFAQLYPWLFMLRHAALGPVHKSSVYHLLRIHSIHKLSLIQHSANLDG